MAVRDTPERRAPCAMVTPTVSTGIPTAELFAADFFDDAARAALDACYLGTATRPPQAGDATYTGYDAKEPLVHRLGGPFDAWDAWDPNKWWAVLWSAAPSFLYENLTSIGLGIHPVRLNATCTHLVFRETMKLLPRHFGNDAALDRELANNASLRVGTG